MFARRSGLSPAEAKQFVRLAYEAVLLRAADRDGEESYVRALVSGRMRPSTLMRAFLDSEEHQQLLAARGPYDFCADPQLQRFRTPQVVDRTERLRSMQGFDQTKFEAVFNAEVATEMPTGQEYLRYHRRRFLELLGAMATLIAEPERPQVLEVGVAQVSRWYSQFFPRIELTTADRIGAVDPGIGVRHVPLDLNVESDYQHLGGPYDLIVFAEVLEHLAIHPVIVFRHLLSRLAPGGALYLTTPNFFSRRNLNWISQRKNPQAIFPESNADGHHHTREFCMGELLPLVEAAGGVVQAWYFSDCWDVDGVLEHERANMVLLIESAQPAIG